MHSNQLLGLFLINEIPLSLLVGAKFDLSCFQGYFSYGGAHVVVLNKREATGSLHEIEAVLSLLLKVL